MSDELPADEVMERVFERMQRAGWIDAIIRKDRDIMPQITKFGQERFRQLARIERELECDELGKLTDPERRMISVIVQTAGLMPD